MGMIGATIDWECGGSAPARLAPSSRLLRGLFGQCPCLYWRFDCVCRFCWLLAAVAASRFFPVGPVVLSKVTASTRTGGVIGTLSRSAADSLGGTSYVVRGTSSSSSLRMSAGHVVLQSGTSARGRGWLLPSRGESDGTLGTAGRMGVGGSALVSGEFPGVGSGVGAGVGRRFRGIHRCRFRGRLHDIGYRGD
jgi:hypothetical protein